MPYQQRVINPGAIPIGSVKVEVGDDISSLASLGTGGGAKFAEKITVNDLISDNGGLVKSVIKEHICEVSYNMWEFDLDVMRQIRGGIDTYSTISGSATEVTGEAHGTGWTIGTPFKLTYKNGANTIVASIAVKAGGGALTAGTDYNTFVGDGSNGLLGYTYIVPITAQTLAITADYTYTPFAAQIIKTGGLTSISSKVVRLTNTNDDGKIFRITIYKAQNSDGISIDFPSDEEVKNWENTVKFTGRKDANRTAGDQLFEIYNEQAVA
jgi:hypothetical protein